MTPADFAVVFFVVLLALQVHTLMTFLGRLMNQKAQELRARTAWERRR